MTTQQSHKMGLGMATIVGMNAMIGASIFLIPERLQPMVGPAALLTYALVIATVWCLAYSLARMAELFPQEGSFFTYVRAWAGKKLGFIAALSYCIGLIVALGLLTRMTGEYLNSQFPSIAPSLLATVVLTGLAVSLLVGSRMAHWGQIVLIVLTLAPLFVITALCFVHTDMSNLTPFMPFGFSSVLKAMNVVIFGFFGFEAITALNNLVATPHKTVPRAITWAIILTSLVYVTFVFSTFVGLPAALFAEYKTLPQVLYHVFPGNSWLITMIVWGIIVTIMGTIHAMLWSVGALMQSLTKMINAPFKLSQNAAIILLSTLVWASSVIFKDLGLFFNLTSLFIVFALACAIVPLAIKKVPATRSTRVIAWLGLAASALMWYYAFMGVWTSLVH